MYAEIVDQPFWQILFPEAIDFENLEKIFLKNCVFPHSLLHRLKNKSSPNLHIKFNTLLTF